MCLPAGARVSSKRLGCASRTKGDSPAPRPSHDERSERAISANEPPRWTVTARARLVCPGDRAVERPVELERARPVAEASAPRSARAGGRARAARARAARRRRGRRRRAAARRRAGGDDLAAERHEPRGERVDERLRTAARERPAVDVRGGAEHERSRRSRRARAAAPSARRGRRRTRAPGRNMRRARRRREQRAGERRRRAHLRGEHQVRHARRTARRAGGTRRRPGQGRRRYRRACPRGPPRRRPSGCTAPRGASIHSTSRPRSAKAGDVRANGSTAAQTSWRKPGSVSSAVRQPPPIVSAASCTVTCTPARARAHGSSEPVRPTTDDDSALRRSAPLESESVGNEPPESR